MSKKELKIGAITKERLKDIMTLRKNKEYDKIFEVYGQRIYNVAVPSRVKRKEIKQLIKEGRFEDIYRKYGDKTYNEHINEMMQIDIYNETGSKPKSIFNRIKNVLLRRVAPIALSAAILTPAVGAGTIDVMSRIDKEKNAIEYAREIDDYNRKIQKYAEEVNSMHLTDTQIFMKLMKDMWSEIDGYANPSEEIEGYFRLSLDSEGVGVCRNFADDMTAKLNAINPNYNARNLVVYADENSYKIANIERNIIEDNETVVGETDTKSEQNLNSFDITKLTGNHMITAVDIPDKGITLTLDPTNPGLGVVKDGQIHLFSTPDGKGIKTKALGQFILEGINSVIKLGVNEAKSFLPCKYSLEELKQDYGTEAQNNALDFIESLEQNKDKTNFVQKVAVDEKKAIENIQENDKEIQLANIER